MSQKNLHWHIGRKGREKIRDPRVMLEACKGKKLGSKNRSRRDKIERVGSEAGFFAPEKTEGAEPLLFLVYFIEDQTGSVWEQPRPNRISLGRTQTEPGELKKNISSQTGSARVGSI
jgi:hypothetical protein